MKSRTYRGFDLSTASSVPFLRIEREKEEGERRDERMAGE